MIIVFLAAVSFRIIAQSTVLIAKFDFENGTVDKWGIEGNRSNFTFTVDETNTHSGRYCARLTLTKPSEGERRRYMGFSMPSGQKISKVHIRFYLRTEGIADGDATMNGLENSSKGVVGWLSGNIPLIQLKPAAEWTFVEAKADIKAATSGVVLYLVIKNKALGKGSVWIDDLSIEGIQ